MRFSEFRDINLQEVNYQHHKKLVVDHMRNLGYRKIGAGADALVFAKDAGQAIKIILPKSEKLTSAENTFTVFYNYVKQNPSDPYLPKFFQINDKEHEFFTIDGETFRQTAMERLKPIPPGSELDKIVFDMFRSIRSGEPYDSKFDQYQSFYDSLKRVMDTGTQLGFTNDIMDFNHSNVMLRGKIPVIVDPWVN